MFLEWTLVIQDVLFQIDAPLATEGLAEYYDLGLYQLQIVGQEINLVRESHGWWSNKARRAVLDLDPQWQTREFKTYREAVDEYCRRRLAHIQNGFVHSFGWHPFSGIPFSQKTFDTF
jgi:hypothetical protein